MNGHAPPDLVSRRSYLGLRHAGTLDSEGWLRERLGVKRFRLIPASARREEVLFRKLCAFCADLETVPCAHGRALKAGGHVVFVIANNVIRGSRIQSHRILARLAAELGFLEDRTTARGRLPHRAGGAR